MIINAKKHMVNRINIEFILFLSSKDRLKLKIKGNKVNKGKKYLC